MIIFTDLEIKELDGKRDGLFLTICGLKYKIIGWDKKSDGYICSLIEEDLNGKE